jgi:hypothetical protein
MGRASKQGGETGAGFPGWETKKPRERADDVPGFESGENEPEPGVELLDPDSDASRETNVMNIARGVLNGKVNPAAAKFALEALKEVNRMKERHEPKPGLVVPAGARFTITQRKPGGTEIEAEVEEIPLLAPPTRV